MSTGGIWSIPVKETGSGDFTPCPAGNHPGRIAAILDVGHQQTTRRNDKTGMDEAVDVRQLILCYELTKKDASGNPYVMGVRYTWSMNEKANLYKLVRNVTGKAYQPGEEFDPTALLGQSVMVNVAHQNKGDKTYANVSSITGWPEGMPSPSFKHQAVMWSVLEGTPFPDRDWYPRIYGETISDLVSRSCEARGVMPGKVISSHGPVIPDAHPSLSKPAPTLATTVKHNAPADIAPLLATYGLTYPFDRSDLEAKADDIPPKHFAALAGHLDDIPF